MGICCVEGCQGILEDTVYFEFPTSRCLRRKWLDVLRLGSKVALGTVVCSRHFQREEYQIVRGKVRLKKKVVPTLLLQTKSSESQTTEETCQTDKTKPMLPDEKTVEKAEPPQPDSTTDNIVESNDITREEAPKESRTESKEELESEICKVVNKNSSLITRNSVEIKHPEVVIPTVKRTRDSGKADAVAITPPTQDFPPPDPKQPPDFEDMITNYQIKNSKPHTLMPEPVEIEIEVPPVCERDDTIVVDDQEDAPPVFIEINVDKDNNRTNPGNEDCLMVLESVQVEVDPSSLMLPERDFDETVQDVAETERDFGVTERDFAEETDHDCVEVVKPPDKKEEPISLLTSSDEDDVILEEPHIDTVEVSDETDEDDMPLVKLVKKKTPKKRTKKDDRGLKKLVWNGTYDFYCIRCHFTTMDSELYYRHLNEHQKILQVCSVCNYTTASDKQFTRHLRKHKEEKKFQCHLCEYRSRHNMSLMYHIQSHNNDKKFVKSVKKGFQCKKCGFSAKTQVSVLNHVRQCTAKSELVHCEDCDYSSKRSHDLKRHRISKHKEKVYNVDSDSSQGPEPDCNID